MTFFSFFGCKGKQKDYLIKPIFTEMREMAFNVTPDQIDLNNLSDDKAFAIFMESGYQEAIMSLRCIGDGSISIYFSNGGGMIGIGEHEAARVEGLKLINMANEYINKGEKVENNILPKNGETFFYIRTKTGNYLIKDIEDRLGNNKSEYSPLIYQAQNVITQARLIQEKKE